MMSASLISSNEEMHNVNPAHNFFNPRRVVYSATTIDIEKEIVLASHLIFPPWEKFWGQLAIFGNTPERMKG